MKYRTLAPNLISQPLPLFPAWWSYNSGTLHMTLTQLDFIRFRITFCESQNAMCSAPLVYLQSFGIPCHLITPSWDSHPSYAETIPACGRLRSWFTGIVAMGRIQTLRKKAQAFWTQAIHHSQVLHKYSWLFVQWHWGFQKRSSDTS